jgi:hypothetical protein
MEVFLAFLAMTVALELPTAWHPLAWASLGLFL